MDQIRSVVRHACSAIVHAHTQKRGDWMRRAAGRTPPLNLKIEFIYESAGAPESER